MNFLSNEINSNEKILSELKLIIHSSIYLHLFNCSINEVVKQVT
jgi:hypothetical protein